MSLQKFLEDDEEKVKQALRSADTMEQCVPVLEHETDRLLYLYNEEAGDDRIRSAASGLMRQVRSGAALTASQGSVSVYVSADSAQDRKKKSGSSGVLLTAGSVCLAADLVFALLVTGPGLMLTRLLFHIVLLGAGGVCLYLSGKQRGKTAPPSGSRNYVTRIKPDADKLYSTYRAMVLTADRTLAEEKDRLLMEKQRQIEKEISEGGSGAYSAEDLDIIAGLLEASCSGDGDYALTKIEKVRFRLHEMGIEAVDYSEEKREWFDLLPADRTQTIRPALVRDGLLLKKGLAGVR